MSRIMLIAPSQEIMLLGKALLSTLPNPNNLLVELGPMDKAVEITRNLDKSDIDVIISRGSTLRMLEEAELGIPLVDIPISDEEVMTAVREARRLTASKEHIRIGYVGFTKIYEQIKSYLDMMAAVNLEFVPYDAHNTAEVRRIVQKLSGQVDVVIGGPTGRTFAAEFGIPNVSMGSSLKSLQQAYANACGLQKAVHTEKTLSEERNTILNNVSDGIISLNRDYTINLYNEPAHKIFGNQRMQNESIFAVCPQLRHDAIDHVFTTGEPFYEYLMEISGNRYFLNINPIRVKNQNQNVLIVFREVGSLQQMEISVRRRLYLKGNVARYRFEDILHISTIMTDTIENARRFAQTESNILLTGQTGTGKELFAQSIHNASSRKDNPFVAVNCGAIPSDLLESELFGYTEGAFTGAKKGGKMGLFEQAHNGTIFLDEISEMDLYGQVILLRTLQERQVRRIGGDAVIPINVRVIAACNVDLSELVRKKLFRKDLYYRLSVLVLHIPDLNDRKGDIAYLAEYYLAHFGRHYQKIITLSPAAKQVLEAFNWEGNVRQLMSFCERLSVVAPEGVVNEEQIRQELLNSFFSMDIERSTSLPPVTASQAELSVPIGHISLTKESAERMLAENGGSHIRLSKKLGISRMTLWRALKKLGLEE